MRTVLLVPVPEAAATERFRPLYDPPHPAGIPPHVTILFPFLRGGELTPDALAAVAEAVASVAPFDAVLARAERFPGTTYLAPDPAEPFAELTRRTVERFPQHQPYGGEHDTIVPHLTVASTPDHDVLRRVEQDVAALLPIRFRVVEAWLMAEDEHGVWSPRARFPLGG